MESRKSFFTDLLFIIFCTTATALCILLFWRDLNAALYRLGEQPVGTITFRYNAAQRRFVDRVIWDRLRNDSPVFNGDIIRTAALSEATVTFEFGDIINLSSNTLIQIFVDDRGARIDFAGGGISVAAYSGDGMTIYSGYNRLAIDPGAIVRAASLEDGALDIAVSEGTVVLEGAGGAHTIEAGSGLFLSAEGAAIAIPQAVATFPPPGARFLNQSSGDLPVDFTWNKINYAYGGLSRLEVASDRSFNRLLFAQNTSESQISLPLPEGTWFWRLHPVAEGLPPAPYSRITIVHSPVPTLISPLEGQTFSFRSRPPPLRFQWSSSPLTFFYLLEAADNPLMQNPALSIQVSSPQGDRLSVVSSALEEGRWYWRVTPVYSRAFTGYAESSGQQASAARTFVIERGAPLAAPVQMAPLANAQVNIETGRRDIIFSWRREAEAVSYTFRVSSNSDMSAPIIEQTLTGTFFRYTSDQTILSPGTWYWTVQQTGPDGDISPPSQPRAFSAMRGEIVQRPVFPPDNFVIAESLLNDVRFTWRTNLDNTRFQVAQAPDFAQLLINEPAPLEVHTARSLHGGVYYWRIIGYTGAQRLESPARRFTVAESLLPPELILPESALVSLETGSIMVSAGQPQVNFTWAPSPDAGYYIFRLYREDAPEPPVLETIVSGTTFSADLSGLEDGSYIWSVQGLVRESLVSTRRTGFSSSQQISIRQLRPVILEHPRDGWVFEGIAASRTPDTVRWYSQDFPFNTVFTLARDPLMTNIVWRQTGVLYEHVLPRLNAGDYFWTIQAEDAEGFDISSPIPAHFHVLPIPPLPAPGNRIPVSGHTITPELIMASRSVVFSWNRVPGANGYRVTIFRDDGASRVPVIQTPVLRENTYTVEDIRFLGRGNFSWHVESLFVMPDGFIEQGGHLLENSFFVDVPFPAHQLTIPETGILYGW